MNRLKYVVLSDFHLGAPNSMLTAVQPDVVNARIQPNPLTPTATLKALGDALAAFLPALSDQADPPTLILLGDVLDLGFSPPNVVVMAYQRFLESIFPKDRPPLFAKDIIFLPGNHDHSLWNEGKHERFLEQVMASNSKEISPLDQTTAMMDRPSIICRLLTQLMAGYPQLSGYAVKIAYPTWGVLNPKRSIFLHHGHFIESMYRLISDLEGALFGQRTNSLNMSEIERLNGAWIDFGWCGLGEPGDNSYTLYSLMQDPAALHAFTTKLADRIQKKISGVLPMGGVAQVQQIEGDAIRGLFDVVVGRNAELERNSYNTVLSPDTLAGLKWYVDKLVRYHFEDEIGQPLPEDVSFIFGHTHKPFEDQLVLPDHTSPIGVYNTGGWVLDMAEVAATQGASMVLIDDDLRIASLRLFNSPVNGVIQPVQVKGVGGYPDEGNPYLGFVRTQLQSHQAVWQAFSAAAAADIAQRSQLMQKQFFSPTSVVPAATN